MKNIKEYKYKINDKVLIQDFDDEIIILNIETGKYFQAAHIGKKIISLIMTNEYTSENLIKKLREKYNSDDVEEDLKNFLKKLQDLRILEVS